MAKSEKRRMLKLDKRICLAQKIKNNTVVDSVGSSVIRNNITPKNPSEEILSVLEILSKITKESTKAVIEARKSISLVKKSIEEKESTPTKKENRNIRKRNRYPPSCSLCEKCGEKSVVIMDGKLICLNCLEKSKLTD